MELLKKGLLGLVGAILLIAAMSTGVFAHSIVTIENTEITINENDDIIPISITVLNTNLTDSMVGSAYIKDSTEHDINDYVETNFVIPANTQTSTLQTLNFALKNAVQGDYIINLVINGDDIDEVFVAGLSGDKKGEDIPLTIHIEEAVYDKDTEIAPGLIDEIDVEEDTLAPGETVDFEATLETDEGERYEDVKLIAWLEDEFGERLTSKYETSEFNIGKTSDDDKEVKSMSIPIPVDADEGEYTLVVRVEGIMERDSVTGNRGLLDMSRSETIDVEKRDHSFKLESVKMADTAVAGSTINFEVTVLNNGNNDENDVFMQVAIPELGIAQTSSGKTLEEGSTITNYFTLSVPASAEAGEYNVLVSAYNNKFTTVSQFKLKVSGESIVDQEEPEILVNEPVKSVGDIGVVYTLSITNTGSTVKTLSFETAGLRDWGTGSINPPVAVIPAGATKMISVFVTPNEGVTGSQQFTVFVKEGSQVIDSVVFTAEVESDETSEGVVTAALKWAIGILILVLVVVFIVWTWRREISGNTKQTTRKTSRRYY